MTPAERETLEALAASTEDMPDAAPESLFAAGAVRTALATIDALRAEIADLRARAIPKAWLDDGLPIHLSVEFEMGGLPCAVIETPTAPGGGTTLTIHGTDGQPGIRHFPTLADALAAAALASDGGGDEH